MAAERPNEAAASARLDAARTALARGEAEAARAAARAARQAQSGSKAGGLAEAWAIEAVASSMLSDYPAALQCAMEAEGLLQPDDVGLRLRVLNVHFLLHAQSGNLAGALECSRRSVELAEACGDRYGAARALHNRGILFTYVDEFDAAQESLRDAVAGFEALPDQALNACFARVSLAAAYLKHAHHLGWQGRTADAQARRRTAEQVLPTPDATAAMAPTLPELTVLGYWVVLLAEVGRLAEARRGLRRCLMLQRLTGRMKRYQAYAMTGVAGYCFHKGQVRRGLRVQEAAVAHLRSVGNRLDLLDAQHRLVQMYESRGAHAQALAGLREARAERLRLAVEQALLSCRLATVEREVRLRHAAQRELQAHLQRLAVVGRLMADIHHALDQPLTEVQQALAACMAAAPHQREPALQRVIQRIEAASGLVRQLRMFSYRAAPLAMVVNLQDSLREAWDGMAPWRRGAVRHLQASGEARVQVCVDTKRLAVLLRILLIEVDHAWPEGALAAQLQRGPAWGRLQLGSIAAAADSVPPVSVGLTLCREIAEELGGRLTHGPLAGGGAGFHLELPLE